MIAKNIFLIVFFKIFSHFDDVTSASYEDDFESILANFSDSALSEDGKLNFTQLATKYGHSAEQCDVTTEDGYILTLFHIPGDGPSVLLFHGLCGISENFIIRGNTSLAITLANAGYNVWAGNNRGNKYGRRHITLDPDTDKEFWNYSFHEIGYYDLAAIIDFIRSKTGEDSIATIGHSQGNAANYALTSTRPEYNDRIKVTISLAPIAYFYNLRPYAAAFAVAGPALTTLLELLGKEELFQDRNALSDITTLICSDDFVGYAICAYGLIFPLYGFNPSTLEPEFLRTALGTFPAATSRKSLVHINQLMVSKRFRQYDYGVIENLANYGTVNPPDYDLSAIKIKVALLGGKNDQLATVENVERLRGKLPNVVHYEILEPKLWSHLDFVVANNLYQYYLHPIILDILKQHALT